MGQTNEHTPMWRHRILILIIGCLLPLLPLAAQNGTSSPYSAFAFGDINDNVPNTYRAMGEVGIGMRSNKVINPMQPASYTACDSLTFMCDVAAAVSWSHYADAAGVANKANGNLEYLAMQFPLWKRYIAFSAGLIPFSAKGYNITGRDSIRSAYHYTTAYQGSGGISQVYGGLSFNICDWVALGANIYYMFGQSVDLHTLTFDEAGLSPVIQGVYTEVSSVRLRYGMQLFHDFGGHAFSLGAVFENKARLHSSEIIYESTFNDTVSVKDGFQTPLAYGVGASYTWANRLTVAFDYMHQDWASAEFLTLTGYMTNRDKYALGIEYRHNPLGRNYAERVRWRLGANVVDNYIPDVKQPDFTVTLGVGLPLRTVATVFNASLEYTHRGGDKMMQENMLKLTINAAISENWFFKRKL